MTEFFLESKPTRSTPTHTVGHGRDAFRIGPNVVSMMFG